MRGGKLWRQSNNAENEDDAHSSRLEVSLDATLTKLDLFQRHQQQQQQQRVMSPPPTTTFSSFISSPRYDFRGPPPQSAVYWRPRSPSNLPSYSPSISPRYYSPSPPSSTQGHSTRAPASLGAEIGTDFTVTVQTDEDSLINVPDPPTPLKTNKKSKSVALTPQTPSPPQSVVNSIVTTDTAETEEDLLGNIPDPPTSLKKTKKGKSVAKPDMIWSNDQVEMLLRLWEENEPLHKKNHPLYMDCNKKSLIHQEIACKIGTTLSEVQKKMKSMYSYFCQLRSRAREPNPSGSAASVSKPITWPWYEHMQFLLEQFESDPTIGNETRGIDGLREDMARPQSYSRKRNADQRAVANAMMERAVTALEKDITNNATPPPPPPEGNSEAELFGRMVASEWEKLEDGDDKGDLKIDILQQINTLRKKQRNDNRT